LATDRDRYFFRIVIGCFSHHEGHWAARNDLRANGLLDDQMCSIGSLRALVPQNVSCLSEGYEEAHKNAGMGFELRQVRELVLHVSAADLFDQLWPSPYHHEGNLTHWMTPSQSGVVWCKLRQDCPLLMVNADSAKQQVTCSQIQLHHRPTVVQAFNFAVRPAV
jgi:hypothetical protein